LTKNAVPSLAEPRIRRRAFCRTGGFDAEPSAALAALMLRLP